ncbi:MAG TPA: cytochrome c [Candidatus Dormibacteraeota bacterium]|nr:cytochrome c [Candidatus Dormibacteraeota bacterium]
MLACKLALRCALLMLILIPAEGLFSQSPEKKSDDAKPALNVAAGKSIFEKRCAVCHSAATEKKKIGPGLKGLGKRETFAEGKPINDQSLRTWIENGGKSMPSFKGILTADEIRDVIAYLKTL